MNTSANRTFVDQWNRLPIGARSALEQQWKGLASGGLPCGSAVIGQDGRVVSVGRNHAYDLAEEIETRAQLPLQHNRLAHAELNAIALIPTETDHASLALWSTQHPCLMCAAAVRFTGIGSVYFVADDPSDVSTAEAIRATRGGVPYQSLGDPLWWTVSNLLFLYNSAVQRGEEARNLKVNRVRYPELVRLTLDLAKGDALGPPARSGTTLPVALEPHSDTIREAARHAPMGTA
jgi:tRNA(Arg) A34 adenosine deaminase TadA